MNSGCIITRQDKNTKNSINIEDTRRTIVMYCKVESIHSCPWVIIYHEAFAFPRKIHSQKQEHFQLHQTSNYFQSHHQRCAICKKFPYIFLAGAYGKIEYTFSYLQ